MRTRVLGGSGIEVGAIGLGCMGFTHGYDVDQRDDDRSVAVVHRALDLGVTLLDTSDVYGPFTNEELVGRAVVGHRERAVLATKCGIVPGDSAAPSGERDGSPEYVRAACDASLRRLGVDHVDLYQLHRVDPATPVEETWGAFAGLVEAGKVRAIGLSEVGVEELAACHAIHPVATVQSELSLWTRDWAGDVLPWCRANGVSFLPYAPLGRGFLTGALSARTFGPGDFRSRLPRFAPDAMAANQAIVDAVGAVAARVGATSAQVALAWLLAQGEEVVPIPGTKRVERVEENAAAADLVLAAHDLAELDALPAPAGGRY
jgi:aryl-alcohol dehydrogenase-like predicted oxidoreductase